MKSNDLIQCDKKQKKEKYLNFALHIKFAIFTENAKILLICYMR